jgi:histidyl-tRNA synthetase
MTDKIYKPRPISGFSELLPEYRIVEQQWLDHIRRVFESYGFCSIETPSVEEIDVLTAKGETDKEIYTLTRLQAEESDASEARLGLHFDQTVPFARYAAQHFNDLVFPFKRYQMQRVWRGERPQLGREREFKQCDIDVINVDSLPLHFDAELAAMMCEVLDGLKIGRFQMRISNRKILIGLLAALGIEDTEQVTLITRIIDKLEKIGVDQVSKLLSEERGLSEAQIGVILKLTLVKTACADELQKQLLDLNITHTIFQEGIEELCTVLQNLSHVPDGQITADLSIVRGLDYYTGTVYETQLLDIPEFTSSVCSGGRYEDLAGSFINRKLPGVGVSIGFTRLFNVLKHHGYIKAGAKSPADILMVLPSDEQRALTLGTAKTLRMRGFKVETYHAPQKVKKQLSYAEKKSIPFVWFPPFEDGQPHEIKNMNTGEQVSVCPETWEKP